MSDFASHVTDLVRDLLKAHPAFAAMKRGDYDLYLADLENNVREDFESWADGIASVAYEDGRADAEFEAELKAEATKKKQGTKQRKRAAA